MDDYCFVVKRINKLEKIILVRPRGFCAGVERAVNILDMVVKNYPKPIYCKHEIVHNRYVVDKFRSDGVIFVKDIEDVPDGSVLVLSAHGSSPIIYQRAKAKSIRIIDATCPLVTKVHLEARRYQNEGYFIIYVGHKDHPETVGVLGELQDDNFAFIETIEDVEKLRIPNDSKRIILLNQTTLSLLDIEGIKKCLKSKYKNLEFPLGKDICYATTNRQMAVEKLTSVVDMILVVGSQTSSNSRRLVDLSERHGKKTYLIDDQDDLKDEWFDGVKIVGITAGASSPDELIETITKVVIKRFGGTRQELKVVDEDIKFINYPTKINI